MTTAEMPITRSDLREELQRELRHYATKEDLANLKADLRGDLTRLILAMVALQAAGLGAVAAIVRFADMTKPSPRLSCVAVIQHGG